MAQDLSIFALLNGDSSGFVSAVKSAQSALEDFQGLAAGFLGGIGAADIFGNFTHSIENFTTTLVSKASEFQSFGQSMNVVMGSMGTTAETLGSSSSAATSKAAASALEAQDALIKYNEKMKEIQDNITTVMRGENIIQAQEELNSKLSDLADQHLAKIQDINDQIAQANEDLIQREADQAQSMQNTLQDMQDTQGNKVADIKEKQQTELDKVLNPLAKKALQAKFDEENKLTKDSYDRAYATKQAELQRNLDQEKAKDDEANAKKLSSLQDRIKKENQAYTDQQDKLRDASDKQIAKLETDNAKKLALYQRELADEERSYQLSVAKREASAAGGGNTRGPLEGFKTGDPFLQTKESLGEVISSINDFSKTAPFSKLDIEQSDKELTAMGVNIDKMNPVIGNLAGVFGQSFGTGAQAIIAALSGRFEMLRYQLHISEQQLEGALGGKKIQSANDLMQALTNLSNVKYGGVQGLQTMMNTLPGKMSNVQDRIDDIILSFMGMEMHGKNAGTVIKGSLMDVLLNTMQKFADFLEANHAQLESAFRKMGEEVSALALALLPFIEGIVRFTAEHPKLITGILVAIGVFGLLIPIVLGVASAIILLFNPIGAIVVAVVVLTGVISALAAAILLNFKNSQGVIGGAVTFIKTHFDALLLIFASPLFVLKALGSAVEDLIKRWRDGTLSIKNVWSDFTNWIGGQLGGLVKLFVDVGSKIGSALSYLNPFAKHSPSLVDQVQSGVGLIKSAYAGVASMKITAPQISPSYAGSSPNMGSGIGNYNAEQPNTNNVTMNNTYNVPSQSTASMVTEYQAFQLEHLGLI